MAPADADSRFAGEAKVILEDELAAHLDGILELVPKAAQHVVTMKRGESCRQLGANSLPGVDWVRIHCEPGAVSPRPDDFVRHAGHEFNYMLSGEAAVIVGSTEYRLTAGDSLTLPHHWPHRVLNRTDQLAEILCLFVRGTAISLLWTGES
jgi:quercetin dioxygenase-like cupin family protein